MARRDPSGTDTFELATPFRQGLALEVTQGPGGATSHAGDLHLSWDFARADRQTILGEPVLAVADGTVESVVEDVVDGDDPNADVFPPKAGSGAPRDDSLGDPGALGNVVTLRHEIDGTEFFSSYMHLAEDSAPFEVGETVQAGEAIGKVGLTGSRTGPHAHVTLGPTMGAYSNPNFATDFAAYRIAEGQPGTQLADRLVFTDAPEGTLLEDIDGAFVSTTQPVETGVETDNFGTGPANNVLISDLGGRYGLFDPDSLMAKTLGDANRTITDVGHQDGQSYFIDYGALYEFNPQDGGIAKKFDLPGNDSNALTIDYRDSTGEAIAFVGTRAGELQEIVLEDGEKYNYSSLPGNAESEGDIAPLFSGATGPNSFASWIVSAEDPGFFSREKLFYRYEYKNDEFQSRTTNVHGIDDLWGLANPDGGEELIGFAGSKAYEIAFDPFSIDVLADLAEFGFEEISGAAGLRGDASVGEPVGEGEAQTVSTIEELDLGGSLWDLTGEDRRGTEWSADLVFDTVTKTAGSYDVDGYFDWTNESTGVEARERFELALEQDFTFSTINSFLPKPVSPYIPGTYNGAFADDGQSLSGEWTNGIPGTFAAERLTPLEPGWTLSAIAGTALKEGETTDFTVARPDTSRAETVFVSTVQDRGWQNEDDYAGMFDEPLTFAAGEREKTISLTTRADNASEAQETFGLIVQADPKNPVDEAHASTSFTIADGEGGETFGAAEALRAGAFLARATYGGGAIPRRFRNNELQDKDEDRFEYDDDYQGYLSSLSDPWTVLTADALGAEFFEESGTTLGGFTEKGLYRGEGDTTLSLTEDNKAEALLARTDLAGETTLVLAFRGTDGSDAFTQAQTFTGNGSAAYYEALKPLIEATRAYAVDNEISNVVVSGHSLGGSMADIFTLADADRFEAAGLDLRVVSLASAGVDPGLHASLPLDDDLVDLALGGTVIASLSTPEYYTGIAHGEDRVTFSIQPGNPLTITPNLPLYDNKHFGRDYTIDLQNIENSDVIYRTLTSDGYEKNLFENGFGAEHNGQLYWANLQALTTDPLFGSYEGQNLVFGIADYSRTPDYDGTPISLFQSYTGASAVGVDNDRGTGRDLFGTGGADYVLGLTGNDLARAGGGADLLSGGEGRDSLFGQRGADEIDGGGGNDRLSGGLGADTLSGGPGGAFAAPARGLDNFGLDDRWTSQEAFPRRLGDIDGDNDADIVGFGGPRTLSALSNGDGTFQNASQAIGNFGQAQHWNSFDANPRLLGDIDGDNADDVLGFGDNTTLAGLANGDGTFQAVSQVIANFSQGQHWNSFEDNPRAMGDIDGDGADDIVGFGDNTTLSALSNGDGTFQKASQALANFSQGQFWSSFEDNPRLLGDIDGDGDDDIVGFGDNTTLSALSNGDGTFQKASQALGNFSQGQYWNSFEDNPRALGDVNGDGLDDIVGFGDSATLIALSKGDGTFKPVQSALGDFGAAQGWNSQDTRPRMVADVDNDGTEDITGFTTDGPLVSQATPDYDTFEFLVLGDDTITDFEANNNGEVIDFSRVRNLSDFADVQANATQSGSDVEIADGADTLTLQGVDLANLDAEDFVF